MQLHTLKKITRKKSRRIGIGQGSGRGKTAGRGTKGQKARGKIPLSFEGGALRLIKRVPFRRGKGKHKSMNAKPVVVNVSALNSLAKGSTVDISTLVKHKIVAEHAKVVGVKILGDGDLGVALTVMLPLSKGARVKIEKAGGKVAYA